MNGEKPTSEEQRARVYADIGAEQPAQPAQPEQPAATEPAAPAATPPQQPVEAAKPVEGEKPAEQKEPDKPKLLFGKYKTEADAEKGYKEAERGFHAAKQEAAALRKQLEQVKQLTSTEQVVQQQTQETAQQAIQQPDMLDLLVNNPQEFMQQVGRQTSEYVSASIRAQQLTATWEQQNPDLIPHKHLLTAEISHIVEQEPETAKDLGSLLNRATSNLRETFNTFKAEGKQETLGMRQETQGTSLSTVTQSAERGTPAQPVEAAPQGETFDQYIARRKTEIKRGRGMDVPVPPAR